jgi:hypothetical protein
MLGLVQYSLADASLEAGLLPDLIHTYVNTWD